MIFTRPLIGNVGFGLIVFSIAVMILMVLSLYTVQVDELTGEREALMARRRKQSKIVRLLAIPAIADRLAASLVSSPSLILAGSIFWLVFFAYITWNLLRAIIKQKEVTSETISMSVSVYLLMAVT
jgi:hypothetical protein